MSQADIDAIFADFRGRHAQRLAWEALGRAFERIGWAIKNETRKRT